jgi:hypothetical protein
MRHSDGTKDAAYTSYSQSSCCLGEVVLDALLEGLVDRVVVLNASVELTIGIFVVFCFSDDPFKLGFCREGKSNEFVVDKDCAFGTVALAIGSEGIFGTATSLEATIPVGL